MSSQSVRYILDENVDTEIAEQLKDRGIFATTVNALSMLGEDDPPILDYAIRNGLVVCTHDSDYIELAKIRLDHTGIVFIPDKRREIGTIVKTLTEIARGNTAAEMAGMLILLVRSQWRG